MLNLDLIDNLYAGLTKEQQQELISLLFKKSKQTMSYFRRTKDISLSKLETLADFFHMPLDYFRVGNTFRANNVAKNNNNVGNVSVSLRREISGLKETLKAKEETLNTKNDLIDNLKIQVKILSTNDVK